MLDKELSDSACAVDPRLTAQGQEAGTDGDSVCQWTPLLGVAGYTGLSSDSDAETKDEDELRRSFQCTLNQLEDESLSEPCPPMQWSQRHCK